jgi:hypothetical protein
VTETYTRSLNVSAPKCKRGEFSSRSEGSGVFCRGHGMILGGMGQEGDVAVHIAIPPESEQDG